ncbi:MAG: FMN-binding protein [Spirochaetales bacterium]|jgi:major membrane immunogen (membrane-anchored lipoprotein)|nr:FMN-binding protein [Spirochaetales bacterium]
MKNISLIAALTAAAFLILAGCGGGALRDGVYAGASGKDDTGAWGEVSLTVRDGKVADCVFVTRQKDGTIKGEDYGKVNGVISNQDYYNKAQLAVRAMEQYARQYAESRDLDAVQAVSGATIAYDQFIEAVENALEDAKK